MVYNPGVSFVFRPKLILKTPKYTGLSVILYMCSTLAIMLNIYIIFM